MDIYFLGYEIINTTHVPTYVNNSISEGKGFKPRWSIPIMGEGFPEGNHPARGDGCITRPSNYPNGEDQTTAPL